ncbi:unnamed protein product [Oikopleura dioica]|uniref:EGF-like domain-containing protein n=1 Tax=Oikopleura dioica TaxID=34765 RepID=E4X253_OIKDI|nr:unnamed protein product [Oikopleura dioica]
MDIPEMNVKRPHALRNHVKMRETARLLWRISLVTVKMVLPGRFATKESAFKQGFSGLTCAQRICVENLCENGGTCSISSEDLEEKCSCLGGYFGDLCEKTPCSSKPCKNGGQCFSDGLSDKFECICADGYSGDTCETEVCIVMSCLNNGTCIRNEEIETCHCIGAFFGDTCEKTPCNPDPCEHGGT